MNHLQKLFSPSLITLAVLLTAAPMASWAATAPDQGTASGFTVLSVGTAIPPSTAADATAAASTTGSTITGDVGSAGAVTLTGSTINGNLVYTGALTNTGSTISGTSTQPLPVQVITDFNTAYGQYANISCDQALTTLDGLTLSPGVYCVDAAATSTGGVLTLNGPSNGTWIFKIGTLGTGALTGTGFSVVMTGGGVPCNVYWQVAEAATMTDSNFVGTILAGAAITITRGTFDGNALAKAEVTLTDATVTGCNATGGQGHHGHHGHHSHHKCNQGVGNGPEGCDPGNSNLRNPFRSDDDQESNDEDGGTSGDPGRKGGNDHDNDHDND